MLSIIMPVLNQPEMTLECIQAIRENTEDFELVIIDNGSEPPFQKPYIGFADCTVIRNEENKGFPAAVNQGIRAAKGDLISLFNNDIIVTPGWANKLIHALDEFDIVGPCMNNCAGMQRVQTGTYENQQELNEVAADWAESYGDHVEEVHFLLGFCIFRRSLFDEVGEFDESMWPCSGEDVDFCLRAREKGYRCGIVRGCYVHHEGSQTFRKMQESGSVDFADLFKRVERHLFERWGERAMWSHQALDAGPSPKGLSLNLGCGYRRIDGFVNIDNRKEVEPDILCDVLLGLPYADASVDMVRAYDFLEHVPADKVVGVMTEIWRVLKPGAVFESLTPDAEFGQGAFLDPYHRSFWVEGSWDCYSDTPSRALYGIKANFKIESITRKESGNRVFHLHVIARAVK